MQQSPEPASDGCFYTNEVESRSAVAEKRGWQGVVEAGLMRWHLCSLDAPTVAVVWAIMLARLAGIELRLAPLLVLGLGTWIVYVLDRVLDGSGQCFDERQSPPHEQRLRERHHFHHRHRKLLLYLCGLAAAMVAALCLKLPLRLVWFYLLLGVPVILYGLLVHRRLLWPRRFAQDRAPGPGRKEAAVALLFAFAVAAPALVAAAHRYRPSLLGMTVLLALLCWLNCALISHAESDDRLRSFYTMRRERQRLGMAALTLACVAAAASLWDVAERPGPARAWLLACATTPAAAVMLSSLLLLTLLAGMRDLRAEARRVRILADLGLLTPLLFLLPRVR